jgi:hypothetical protein
MGLLRSCRRQNNTRITTAQATTNYTKRWYWLSDIYLSISAPPAVSRTGIFHSQHTTAATIAQNSLLKSPVSHKISFTDEQNPIKSENKYITTTIDLLAYFAIQHYDFN